MFDLGTAVGYLMLDTTGFKKGFVEANRDLKTFTDKSASFGDKVNAFGGVMTKVGGNLTKYVTAPLVGVGAALGNMSLKFEDAIAKVSTIADTTQVPMKDLEKAILDLSDKTGIAATDIADNVYNAISAGQKTADAVSFVEESTKLAVAGFTSSASSLDVLTTTLNAYGMKAEEVTHVSDVLITTQNLGKTTVDELSQSMGKVIPVANANKVSLEQLSASYAILTANGINTAESTTYLKGLFNELGKSGTDVSNILKEETGKSFQQLMEEGTSLGDVMQILQEYADKAGVGLSDLFGSVEAGSAALTLAGKGAEYFNQTLDAMTNSTGATNEAFEKMQTKSFDLKKAINEIKNVAIELGNNLMQALAPTIESVIDSIKRFNEWFKSLDDSTKQTIAQIGLFVAALGPVLLILGKTITTISTFVGALKTIAPAISGLPAIFTKLSGLISSLGVNFTGIGMTISGAMSIAKTSVFGFSGALGALTSPIGIVMAAVAALSLAWVTDFGGMRDKTQEIFTSIQEIFQTIWGAIKSIWENDLLGIRTTFEFCFNAIETIFSTVMSAISSIFQIFSALFKGDWEGVWNGVKSLASSIWEGIKSLFSQFLQFIIDKLLSIGADLFNAAKEVFNEIGKGFSEIWTSIGDWWERVKEDPIGTLKETASDWLEAGKDLVKNLWDGMKDIWDDLNDWVDKKAQKLWEKLQEWGREFGQQIDGVKRDYESIKDNPKPPALGWEDKGPVGPVKKSAYQSQPTIIQQQRSNSAYTGQEEKKVDLTVNMLMPDGKKLYRATINDLFEVARQTGREIQVSI